MSSLGKDLAAVRKHQERSLDYVFERTRIPVHILESIEDDSIFSDFDENTTYIRSFVRSYAKTLKIHDQVIVEALNQEENDEYDGLISKRDQEGTLREPLHGPAPQYDTSHPQSGKHKSAGETDSAKSFGKVPPEQMTGGRSTSYSRHASTTGGNTPTLLTPQVNVNWADMGKKFSQLEGSRPVWIVFVIIIVVALVGTSYFFLLPDNSSNAGSSSTATPADTSGALSQSVNLPDSLKQMANTESDTVATGSSNSEPEQQDRALPDTLDLLIYAVQDKLEPVRVMSDVNDRLSPYWIEHEEAMRFQFVDSIKIRGQYNRMLLLYNGHQIEDHLGQYYNRQQRFIILNRSLFEQSKWYEPAPDTLPAGVPQPTVIRERPQF